MSATDTWVLEEAEAAVGRIRVVGGPSAGAEHAFVDPRAVLGSGAAANLVLADPTISRLHCELSHERGLVRLRDLGSKNGCRVAGTLVLDALLSPGTRVQVGASTIEIAIARERRKRVRWLGGDRFGQLFGASVPMQDLFGLAGHVASLDSAVLVRGESGSGKELLARAIQAGGPRRAGPLVVLDCAGLTSSVADVELFGYVRGAFTGADGERPGVFERASGGTLLIDEIAELPLELQTRLLRALDRGEIRRVGDSRYRSVDVRVIALTSADLERRVNEGSFREDLLHRLGVIDLRVPPLRERGRDAIALARELAIEAGVRDSSVIEAIEREVAGRIGYQWPGNVRELRSYVRRALALGTGEAGRPDAGAQLPVVRVDVDFHEAKKQWLETFERQYLRALLDACGGNVSEAARRAGLNRAHLHEMIEKLGLR